MVVSAVDMRVREGINNNKQHCLSGLTFSLSAARAKPLRPEEGMVRLPADQVESGYQPCTEGNIAAQHPCSESMVT